MVLWGPGVLFRPFPCHPPYTREVGVPIRRLKILAKFALPESKGFVLVLVLWYIMQNNTTFNKTPNKSTVPVRPNASATAAALL